MDPSVALAMNLTDGFDVELDQLDAQGLRPLRANVTTDL